MGSARALYSNTTELEMIWLLKATWRVTRPVSWAAREKRGQGWRAKRGPMGTSVAPSYTSHPTAQNFQNLIGSPEVARFWGSVLQVSALGFLVRPVTLPGLSASVCLFRHGLQTGSDP